MGLRYEHIMYKPMHDVTNLWWIRGIIQDNEDRVRSESTLKTER